MRKVWNPTGGEEEKFVDIETPLSWRRPATVFVGSDIFRNGVGDETILSIFISMSRAVKHTFFLKTSSIRRAKKLLDRWCEDGLTLREGHGAVLPNVCLGVPVEDQYGADSLIPVLIRTRVAKRFLSIERLEEPLYLTSLKDLSGKIPDVFPDRWEDFPWPEWVPSDVRTQIERFWTPSVGRSPKEWIIQGRESMDAYRDCIPSLGAFVAFDKEKAKKGEWVEALPAGTPGADGRGFYIHCWNNIGRIVLDDGSIVPASVNGRNYLSTWTVGDPDFNKRKMIDFVFLGKEGNSEDISSLRKECSKAGVPVYGSLEEYDEKKTKQRGRKEKS